MKTGMTLFLFGTTCTACLVLAGCANSTSSESGGAVNGQAFLLREPPADPLGVMACRERLEERDEPLEVSLVGRVGGLSQPTWDPEQAVFMVADLGLEQHEASEDDAPPHDADNCPYCRARKQKELAGLAMIKLVDAQGNTPAVSARQLLGVSEGQTIIVQGTAQLDPNLGSLLVETRGVYVQADEG